MSFMRSKLHKIINELPEDELHDALLTLQSFKNTHAKIPFFHGVPVIKEGNQEHGKFILNYLNDKQK